MQKMESHIRKVPGSLLIVSGGYHLSMWNLLEENRTLLCVRTWSLLGFVCYITPVFHGLWQLWQSDWPLVEEELFAFFPFWWVRVHLLPASRMNQHMAPGDNPDTLFVLCLPASPRGSSHTSHKFLSAFAPHSWALWCHVSVFLYQISYSISLSTIHKIWNLI